MAALQSSLVMALTNLAGSSAQVTEASFKVSKNTSGGNGSKLLYSEMEKMAYAVVMAACKLRYYFQCHKIKVPTSFPLRDMFENREASGGIGKWATQLAEHTIDFVSRSAIKSQVLADFIADWTPATPSQE